MNNFNNDKLDPQKSIKDRPMDCCICDEISQGYSPKEIVQAYGVKNRTYLETAEFLVVPSVSPLDCGHLLVIPKIHVESISRIPIEWRYSFIQLVRDLSSILSKKYTMPYIFEHGVMRPEQTACGINHAHIHLLPLNDYHRNRIQNLLISSFPYVQRGKIGSILFDDLPNYSYLLYGDSFEEMRIANAEEMTSQYIRKLIANELEIPEWDWKSYFGISEFKETLSAII